MEMVVEEQAVQLLALQQPVAVDLRFLVAALKINNDLERIGDHAVNIAEGAERLAGQKPFKPFIDINYMAEVAMTMLKQSLDAFVNRDATLAKQVIKKDDIWTTDDLDHPRALTYMAEVPEPHHLLPQGSSRFRRTSSGWGTSPRTSARTPSTWPRPAG
jgi:phosphate transport system protein